LTTERNLGKHDATNMKQESVGKQHRMLCNQKFTGQRLLLGAGGGGGAIFG